LLGALVMTHADDDGMRMPPRVAPQQIIIAPIFREDSDKESVLAYCEKLKTELLKQSYAGQPLRVRVDKRDMSGADKKWEWIKKGVPLLVEVGPRDVAEGKVCVMRRDSLSAGKAFVLKERFVEAAVADLEAMQKNMFDQALSFQKARTVTLSTKAEFDAYFSKDADNTFVSGQGFVRAKWCGDPDSLKLLDAYAVTVRCIPFDQGGKTGTCVLTGKPATQDVIFARAY
jgi:prolyl-tRNA synthetase